MTLDGAIYWNIILLSFEILKSAGLYSHIKQQDRCFNLLHKHLPIYEINTLVLVTGEDTVVQNKSFLNFTANSCFKSHKNIM